MNQHCAGGTPACLTAASKCVQCTEDSHCADPGAPICNKTTNTCIPCNADAQCEAKNAATKACAAGRCVACSRSEHCGEAARPICVANACAPCTADAQCAAKTTLGPNPGICMSHTDGHCATDAETLYVENRAGCVMTGGGTPAQPFCHPQPAVTLAVGGTSQRLVVLRGPAALRNFSATVPSGLLSVVGQSGALINGGPDVGIQVAGGEVYVRTLTVKSGSNIGVVVDAPGTLRMSRSTVEGNSGGGILINGGGFDITNTIVAGNGPGFTAGLGAWGGVAVQTPATGKPARFDHNTVVGNLATGLSCAAMVAAPGLIAHGNSALDISPPCLVTPCCTGDPLLTPTHRLMPGSPCVDKLAPNMSLLEDIDGDLRPQGAQSDCGADELKP